MASGSQATVRTCNGGSTCLYVPNVPVGTSGCAVFVFCVFVCIGMGARACDRHIPNVPTQTYRHIRDKMAVVAVSLATIPDTLATLLDKIHKYVFGDINPLHNAKQYLMINKKSSRSVSECILACRSWRIKASISTDECWKWHRAGENARQTNRNPARHTTAGILWRHRDIPAYPAGTCKQVLPVTTAAKCEVSPQGAGDMILSRYWLQLRKFLLSALLSYQWAHQILMEQSKENAEIGRIFCRTGNIYL